MSGQVIKCRAAVAWEPNKNLVVEEIEVAPPKAGEARVQFYATGICHTDITARKGLFWERNFPCILGHEGAGVIESIGEGVTSLKPGDKVIPLYMPQCLNCDICKKGKTNACRKIVATQVQGLMPDGTSRFTCRGKTLFHFMGCSTFSEYTVAAEIGLCKIDDRAPLEKTCLLGCGVPTGYGAAIKTAKVEPGSTCAVFGLGCIGLSAVMGCKQAGAGRIFAIDINPTKFPKAKELGATECLNPLDYKKPIHEMIMELTDGGVDFAIECCGLITTLNSAVECITKGWGRAVLMGVPFLGERLPLDTSQLIYGKTLTASLFGGFGGRTELPGLVQDFLQGKLNLDVMISGQLTLDDINKGFDLMNEGKSIRTVIPYVKDA